jgi:single-strand DNA-binding protein
MAGWAQTIIVGNVGRAPTLKYTPAGIPVCDFSVAVTRKIGSKGEDGTRAETTTWFRVTCWRQLAEIAAQYVKKGTQIMVVGVVETHAYLGKDGQPAASLDLTADNFQLLGARAEGDEHPAANTDDVGNIPF